MPRVNPQNLIWSRERAGLELDEAARRIGLSGPRAEEHLGEMERGTREPTRRQLVQMARAYHTPLLALYLREPPRPGARNHDLRTLRERDTSQEAKLEALVRDARVRQALLSNALEDNEEAEPVSIVGSAAPSSDAHNLAAAMHNALDIRLEDYRSKRTIEDAFAFLRDSVERLGIFVLLMGNLGSHHSNISPRVFRGFSFATSIAPFIVINDNDSKSAWSFTLLHEFAHVMLGESDISGYGSDNATERLCDDAASIFLLHKSGLNNIDIPDSMGFDEIVDTVSAVARRLKVSRTMIAYNLLRMRKIRRNTYERLTEKFHDDRIEIQQRESGGGPNYYILRRHRVGPTLIRTVDRMVSSGSLTTPEASKVLGVKPTAVAPLIWGRASA